MNIEKNINGTKAVFKLDGWLDTKNSQLLEQASTELDPAVKELELDLTKLEYISSSGVRQVVALHKKLDLTITNMSPVVMDVFKMTGLDKRLNIK